MANLFDELIAIPMPPGFTPGGFVCREPELTEYLTDGDADRDSSASMSCPYLLYHGEKLVGYFAVLADAIRLADEEKPTGIPYGTAPALKLGRMAVCEEYAGRDVGRWILKYVTGMAREMAKSTGVRYITLDALQRPKLIAWYEANGFVRNEREKMVRKFIRQALVGMKLTKELPQVSMRLDILVKDAEP